MVRLTLLEVHLDGAEFNAKAPFSEAESTEGVGKGIRELRGESEPAEAESGPDSSPMGILVGLAFVAGVVAVARKLLAGSDEEPELERTEAPVVSD